MGNPPPFLPGLLSAALPSPLSDSGPLPTTHSFQAEEPTAHTPPELTAAHSGLCGGAQAPPGRQREAFFLRRPQVSDKGQDHPLLMCHEPPAIQGDVHLSQELGTSYKNGNFLEIQLRVFTVTLSNQGNDF